MTKPGIENSLLDPQNYQGVHHSDIPKLLNDIQDRLHKSILRQCRQAITGDPDRLVRESMSDHYVQTKLKQVDTFNFTLGVGLTLFTEYIILAHPELFPTFFTVLLSFMMIHRFYDYRKTKFHYFMLDFCYFMQISTYLQRYNCPSSAYSERCQIWFKSNYVLSHGPIAFAIIAWKNSLVFHSMDKATSIAIHILPGLFYYLIRWCPNLSPDNQLPNLLPLSWTEQFLYPLGIYITWQLIHFCIQFTIIEKDPTLVTSLRYLAGDAKNPCTIYGTKLAVKLGFIKQGEVINPYDIKTIMMFSLFQLIYTIVTLIPTSLIFNYESINAIYLVIIAAAAVWNGGSYYILIFSQRYNLKFMPKTVAKADSSTSERTLTDKSE